MPSKLTGILAAGGTAIITADEDTELGRLVKNNPGIAVLVPPENQKLFQEVLRTELSKPRNGARINQVARKYAERYLATDRDFIANGNGALRRDRAMNRTDTGSRGNA